MTPLTPSNAPASSSEQPKNKFNILRFLVFFVLGFVLLVGGWTWFLLSQSTTASNYAHEVLAAAAARSVDAAGEPCAAFTTQATPSAVKTCTVLPGPPLTAELTLLGGRKAVVRAE